MTAQYFVDTNILLYAGSNDPADAGKKAKALAILRQGSLGFSAQVMQEFYDAAYRKKRLAIQHEEAILTLERLALLPVASITPRLVLQAIQLRDRYQISYWDAAIVAAALELRCHTLYSEDLNHGQDYERVRVINPFL